MTRIMVMIITSTDVVAVIAVNGVTVNINSNIKHLLIPY